MFHLFACLCFLIGSTLFARAQGNQFEADIRAFEQADLRNPPPTNSILFLGSSTIVGWHSLQAAFPQFNTLNRGFGGSQASDVLYFYDRLVPPYRAPLIVFYEGDNDLSGGKSVDQVFADWTNFVARVARDLPESHVMFISVKPSPSRAHLLPRVRELNEKVRAFNASHPSLLYADVFTPMLGPDGQPRPELFVSDRLHLNATGYAVWESVLVPAIENWAARYPVEVRKSMTNTLLIDFGATDLISGKDATGATHWNNISTTVASSNSSVVSNLVTTAGHASSLSLRMLSRFNGANENGTTSATLYPASATRDSLFGNTETFNNLANIKPRFQISGLVPSNVCHVTFYASRLGVSDNRETRYLVVGAATNLTHLNAANNVDTTATLEEVLPDSSGVLTIALEPGPNNNNANHFTYLGVLQLTLEDGTSFLFDFGSGNSLTTVEDGPASTFWNNVTEAIGRTNDGKLDALLATNGGPTPFALEMISRFNGVNTSGTSAGTNFPATATQDSLFGNTELFEGLTNINPGFKLTGLNPSATYRLTFYASRAGVNDIRETRYTVTGRTTSHVDLDAANNVDATATLDGVRADENGQIIVTLTPRPNNNNANHFTYLGVLRLDWIVPPYREVRLNAIRSGAGVGISLSGQAGSTYQLERSRDLHTWESAGSVTLDTLTTSLEIESGETAAFFRATQR